MKAFQVRLDNEQHRQLKELSHLENVSLNQLVRIAVGILLDDPPMGILPDNKIAKGSNGDSD